MKGALAVGGTVTTGKAIPEPSPVRVGSAGGLLLVRPGTDSMDVAGMPPVMITGGAEDLELGLEVGEVDLSDVGLVLVVDDVLGDVAGVLGLGEVVGVPVGVLVFGFVFVFVFVDWVFCDRTAVARIPRTRLVKSGLFTLIFEGSFDVRYVQ